MAFGIDDALSAAAAGVNLTDTVVRTVKAYQQKNVELDIERLIEEVRVTALQRIDEADLALVQFERMLVEKNVDLDRTLQAVINATPWWKPFEDHKLKRIRRSFNALSDATYSSIDDIAALVRCRDQTPAMGAAVTESGSAKREFNTSMLHAESVRAAIDRLRTELSRHKAALS